MTNTITRQVHELDAMVVAQIMGRDVTRGELSAAFDRVANRSNWKGEIDAIVDVGGDVDVETIRAAVAFFTGSKATFAPMIGGTLPGCRYHVRAAGYYAAVGA